ncbi:MAG: zeta toxin family protein [Gordonia sp. (in: high G+C Gram-positive bacteria)]|uniref:zeta toxin family protein n=1 Tax=Gordonia sp. (in: high G+C Gram-positive bacteria) TaxID=84139 RepID=UPI0039E618B2
MSNPRLDLVVGSNGAGKSTLIRQILQEVIPGSALVNADDIAGTLFPGDPEGRSYEAARIAEALRRQFVDTGVSFIAETVFSHESKLDLITNAKDAGFRVFVRAVVIPEDLTVQRVAKRVAAGGHSVPENKIRGRYQRLWPLVARAITMADAAMIYDNTLDEMVQVARFDHGLLRRATSVPDWLPPPLRQLLE